jgi:hypothetical protein
MPEPFKTDLWIEHVEDEVLKKVSASGRETADRKLVIFVIYLHLI